MKTMKWLIPLFASLVVLSACSSQQSTSDVPAAGGGSGGSQGGGGHSGGGSGGGYGSSGGGYGSGGGSGSGGGNGYYDGSGFGNGSGGYGSGGGAALLNQRVIYFDYDSSRIRPESMGILDAHAKFLAANPGRNVRLEGHADERGSREYNIALSLDRAESVKRVLSVKGARGDMRAIPYGEEMPAVLGHTPAAWDKNRRVEIVY